VCDTNGYDVRIEMGKLCTTSTRIGVFMAQDLQVIFNGMCALSTDNSNNNNNNIDGVTSTTLRVDKSYSIMLCLYICIAVFTPHYANHC